MGLNLKVSAGDPAVGGREMVGEEGQTLTPTKANGYG